MADLVIGCFEEARALSLNLAASCRRTPISEDPLCRLGSGWSSRPGALHQTTGACEPCCSIQASERGRGRGRGIGGGGTQNSDPALGLAPADAV